MTLTLNIEHALNLCAAGAPAGQASTRFAGQMHHPMRHNGSQARPSAVDHPET